jgi:hypothetical protein
VQTRILNRGIYATHKLIVELPSLNSDVSISDFDAFVFDPLSLTPVNIENFGRRQKEIRDLVAQKGGIAISLLRQSVPLGFPTKNGTAETLGLFDEVALESLGRLRGFVHAGLGTQIEVVAGAKGVLAGYFRVLHNALEFAAYVDMPHDVLESLGGTVFAVDSVRHAVGIEFAVGAGRICVVPIPQGTDIDRVGSAIVRVVEAHYGGPSEIEKPPWSAEIIIPGANANDSQISELEESQKEVELQIAQLRQRRADLLSYRVLLYGYGKSVLEPVVRSAFRTLEFGVLEPDEYEGEWDIELHELDGQTAVGEIEGSEGIINVDKYRQLLSYVQDEALEGRDHKGILIGNGYRLTAPDAPERQLQFSEHALRGAKKNGFCLLPTTELFKAICAVLETENNQALKKDIRASILSTVGVWTFAPKSSSSEARA